MMRQLVFLAGMPRSGSTLLCNVLSQNPDMFVTPTSGLVELVRLVRNTCDESKLWRALPDDERQRHKLAMIRGLVQGRFEGHRGIAVDKNRSWPAQLEFMSSVLGGRDRIFVIVCVRDLRDVLASFEKLFRKTSAFSETPQQRKAPAEFQSAHDRALFLMKNTEPVGHSLATISDAVSRGWRDQMHFVDYDSFCRAPRIVLCALYRFLDAPLWEHDTDNVKQVTKEDDAVHGFLSLHDIRPKVEPQEPQWPCVFDSLVTATPFWKQISSTARFWEAFSPSLEEHEAEQPGLH